MFHKTKGPGATVGVARGPAIGAQLPGQHRKFNPPTADAQRLARRYHGEAIILSGASSFAAEALSVHFGRMARGCA